MSDEPLFSEPVALVQQLLDDDLEDRCGWHSEQGTENAEYRPADQEPDDDRHSTDSYLFFHDLWHEHVILDLLLNDEKD